MVKTKNRNNNLSEFRHIAFEAPLHDGPKVAQGSDGIDGHQPALPVTWESPRVLREKAESVLCFSGHSRAVQEFVSQRLLESWDKFTPQTSLSSQHPQQISCEGSLAGHQNQVYAATWNSWERLWRGVPGQHYNSCCKGGTGGGMCHCKGIQCLWDRTYMGPPLSSGADKV